MVQLTLTPKQTAVLDFLRSHISERGYPPTFREVGDALGIVSTNGIRIHFKALEAKGFIRRESRRSRAIRILEVEETRVEGNDASQG